jgi:tetratricopeptide (TPR) repeat protein
MWGTRAQGVTLFGLVVGVSLAAGIALADDPQNPFDIECKRKATQEDIEVARSAHNTAKQFYERGEYDRAVRYWRDVFNLDCNAIGTLLNLANAYERLGDRQSAINALEAYLKRDPEAADAEKIRRRIENLRNLMTTQPTASASVSAAPVPTASASASSTSFIQVPPPPPRKPYGSMPWITVGVGGAVLVAGAVLLPLGLSDVNAAKKGCTQVVSLDPPDYHASSNSGQWYCPTLDLASQATRGQSEVLFGKIALGVGGAAVIGGVLWEMLANKPVAKDSASAKTGRVHVAPVLGPSTTGVLVHGSF